MDNLLIPLSEENIFNNITILRNNNATPIDIFDNLKRILPAENTSIHTNYLSLFAYDLIVHKTDIKDFEYTIIHMYEQTIKEEHSMEYMFNRFFNQHDTNISLQYFEKNPDDKTISIWDKLPYLFFTVKNEHLGLKNETLPYLETMLKHVSTHNVGGVYGGYFNTMIHSLYANFEDVIPVLNVINNNSAYKIFNPPNHYDFLTHALYYMNYGADNVPKEVKQKVYNIYANHFDGFREAFAHKLIHFNKNENRFEIGYGVANYIFCIGENQALNIIDKTYKQALIEFNDDKAFPDNIYRENNQKPLLHVPHYELASIIKTSLNVFLKNHELEPDCSQIDINQPFYYNFVHLKILEKSISNQENPNVPIETRQYIVNSLEATEDQYQFAAKLVDSNVFKTYFQYLQLNEKIQDKPPTSKKRKI